MYCDCMLHAIYRCIYKMPFYLHNPSEMSWHSVVVRVFVSKPKGTRFDPQLSVAYQQKSQSKIPGPYTISLKIGFFEFTINVMLLYFNILKDV